MPTIKDQFYRNTRIPIDGVHFEQCTFAKCKLIFSAADTVSFENCTFDECDWVFEGAALITLQLMSAIYRDLGTEGEALVDRIVESIKQGHLGQRLYAAPNAAVA